MIDLSPGHLEIVKHILKSRAGGCEVWVYGSRVKGNARKYSDLDLVIKGKQRIQQSVLLGLKDAFGESDLPFCVDVLDWDRISDEFRKRIGEDYRVLLSVDDNQDK
ncbi:MAG: nucleotidyltransferase domain-containing protein [Planctomycetota bacterium]|nr:MAG: nucleotidyltransferase domain-containing protein [Planctomycetota bacterium]